MAGGKGRELVTMFVDWKLRSSKKYESQKTVSQFNLFFFNSNDGNSCNSQWLRGSLWFTLDLHSAQKMLSFDIRFHRVYPKVAIILRIEPFT